MNKPYDFVIFGATSFVGKIMVAHILSETEVFAGVRWAIAGRDAGKLRALQETDQPPIIVADAHSPEAMVALCEQTRVVVSTVGPFALYGETLVKACVETGTDYCDITGEAHWVLQMISKYQDEAAQSGARLVNCCGFDSLPSDLGVYFTQSQARKRFGKPCDEINMRVTQLKGSFSGGTYASLLNAVKQIVAQPNLKRRWPIPIVCVQVITP